MFNVKMTEKEYKAFTALLEIGVDALSAKMNAAVVEYNEAIAAAAKKEQVDEEETSGV